MWVWGNENSRCSDESTAHVPTAVPNRLNPTNPEKHYTNFQSNYGAFIGPKAMQVAATIKMIQNVLIGVSAFCVAVYFATKVEAREDGQKVGAMEIWNRYPKFVIGFIGVSNVLSAGSPGDP